MAEVVIGTCPSTGEVLVRDTDTGDLSWEPGTDSQIASATADIEAAGDYGTVTYQEYDEPEPPYVPPVPVPPEEQVAYVAPTTLKELEALAGAETTGGYAGIEAMAWIIERLNWLSGYFYDIYLEVHYWVAPFNYIAYLMLFISELFSQLAWGFYDLSEWVFYINDRAAEILSWGTIWSTIKLYVPGIETIGDWFAESYNWFTTQVTDWWSSTSTTVLDWIDATKDWARLWIDYLQDQVTALGVRIDDVLALIPDISEIQAWFSNWTGNVSSVINTWWTGALSQVQSLINSAFIEREPFWAGWQDWRDKVTEFFTDPEKWVYDRLDSFFERYW